MKDIYLSVDMDYFALKDESIENINAFMQKLKALDVPVNIVTFHHELFPYVNKMQNISALVNVDYHSDFADVETCEWDGFNEGTWINYCNLTSGNKKFIWYYPIETSVEWNGDRGLGYCHNEEYDNNPFYEKYQGVFRWESTEKYKGLPDSELMNRVAAVGICLSPNWIGTYCNEYKNILEETFPLDAHLWNVHDYLHIKNGLHEDYVHLSELSTFAIVLEKYKYLQKCNNPLELQKEIKRIRNRLEIYGNLI